MVAGGPGRRLGPNPGRRPVPDPGPVIPELPIVRKTFVTPHFGYDCLRYKPLLVFIYTHTISISLTLQMGFVRLLITQCPFQLSFCSL